MRRSSPPSRSGRTVSGVGCGLGAALERALSTGAEVAGIHLGPGDGGASVSRWAGPEVQVRSAEAIPFPEGQFTAVMAVSTYHHWVNPDAGLANVTCVIAVGGRPLMVERKLKKPRGHGIDPQAADRVAASLLDSRMLPTLSGAPTRESRESPAGARRYMHVADEPEHEPLPARAERLFDASWDLHRGLSHR